MKQSIFISLICVFLCPPAFAKYDGPQRVEVRIPKHLRYQNWTHGMGFIADHKQDENFAYGFLELSKLSQVMGLDGIELEVLGPELPVARELYEGYHDYNALTAELQSLAQQYPELARLETAGKSVRGRELWYLVISDNVAVEEREPKLFYTANMHGDETVGRELTLYLSRKLLANYAKRPEISSLVDNAQIYIMPSMNPDGFELGRRYNANGVDLNRNFPDKKSDPEEKLASREPEVQAIIKLSKANHFITSINWHGGAVCVNIPWDNMSNSNPSTRFWDDEFIHETGRKYTELNQPMYDNHHGNFKHGLTYGYEWYPVYGGIQDYHVHYAGSIMATLELSNTKWPGASQLDGFWEDNREAMLTWLQASLNGIHVHVTNARGEDVRGVSISLQGAPAGQVSYGSAYINKPTVEGSQTFTLTAAGYEPLTLTLQSDRFDGEYRPVTLSRVKPKS